MSLQKGDFDTAIWKRIEAVLNDRLESYRKLNDQDQDATKTALLRGRIKEVKSLLALSKPEELTKDAGN